MLDPRILDELITEHTAESLRHMLEHDELDTLGRTYLVAAIYYLEETEDND